MNDGRGRTCFAVALLAALNVERVMQAIQSAVPGPQVEIVEQRAAWGKILRNRPPLASRAQNVHEPIHHLTDVNAALVPAAFGRRNQRLDMRPLVVSQVAWIPQPAAVVTPPDLLFPHRWPPRIRPPPLNHTGFPERKKIPDRHLGPSRQVHWRVYCKPLSSAAK